MRIKKKKVILYVFIIVIIGALIGGTLAIIKSKNDKAIETHIGGYSFETTEKNVINKKLEGKYLESFVTVAENQEEFTVNVEEVDSTSNVFIINPNTGDMTQLKYNNGRFSTNTILDKDINYGIIVDYTLVGSIRVVENLDEINQEQLFRDILIGLGCGLG